MKNHYLQICILLAIFLCASFNVKSQDAVPLGKHHEFVDKLKNQTSLAAGNKVSLKISETRSLTGSLNIKKKEGDSDVFMGKIDNESNSTFFITATPSGIEGNIILIDKKTAYEYYSDALGDPYIKAIDINKVLCIDYNKAEAAAPDTSGVQYAPAAGSTSYTLQSLPGAVAVAYLDFNGHNMPAGSRWNGGAAINALPSSFTESQVIEMWKMISEDYRPFNINVTTDSMIFAAAPNNRRQRCVFTPTNTAAPGAGGVAYLNSFSNANDNDTPCWVFNSGVKSGGEAGSHELGHTFGLSHDGTSTLDYYQGDGTGSTQTGYWAPIMGAAYYEILGQWSKGEYPDANNHEDDLAIISKTANGVTYRADEAGNTLATAKVLTIDASGTVTGSQNYGIITTRTDLDVYSFTTSGGTVSITVNPSPLHPDLNVLLSLTDASGTVLTTVNPSPAANTSAARTASLAASISTTLAAGTYYITVDGGGEGDPTSAKGFSDYASLGEYTISGTIPVTGGSIPPIVSLTAPAGNATFCSGTIVALTATATDADGSISKVEFFDGSTLITTLTASPYTYNWTTTVTGVHSITAKATDNGNLATTSSSVSITVNATPAAPTTANTTVNYCQNASATRLTATGTSLKWYTVPSGGTSTTAPTPSTATAGTTYYYVSQTTNSCESPRTMITVNVNSSPLAPAVITPVTYCHNAPASPLTATGTALKWYTASTGGTGSATAPTPVTTTVGTTNRYVSQTLSGCESQRAAIAITVSASPSAPSVPPPVSYCQNASAAALTATGVSLKWYTVSTGGTGSSAAPTPVTTSSGTTNYYVSQSINGCESSRAAIAVTVNAIPSAPAAASAVNYCQNAAATALTATGTALKWYTVAAGGTSSSTAPTPSTAATGTTDYYVSQTTNGCESGRTTIAVTVNTPPSAPAVTATVTYCQSAAAAALTATGTSLKWYNIANGGTSSPTAPTPSTSIAGTTNYYVSQTVSGCESPRAAIAVTVNPAPAPAVSSPVTYCQNATATALTASGTSLKWYTAPTGGTGSSTAPTPMTTSAGTTNYYVSQTTNGCESGRALITAMVNIAAAPSVVSPPPYCQNVTAIFQTPTGTSLLWYTVPTGGTGSPTTPTSPATPGITNYYVSQTVNGCESARSIVTFTVIATSPAPDVVSPVTYCQNATAAALTATGTNLQWYNAPTGGTGSALAPTPVTGSAGTTDYYVSQNTTGCESARTMISVSVNAPATASVTAGGPTIFTQGGSVLLSANAGTGLTYKWFNGAVQVGTGSTYTATTAGNYTVEVTNGSGCKATSSVVTVTVNGNQPPVVAITGPADNASFPSPANLTITASASDPDGSVSMVQFYNGPSLLGADASSPYSFAMNSLPQGTYTLTAVATDNYGLTSTSSVITFTVINTLPTVSITSPSDGTGYVETATVTIHASASDANGTITLVEFYNGTTLIGSDATSPYSFTWNSVAAGTYLITARATDNEGGKAVSSVISVTVSANQPSVITITSPINNSTVTGTSVTVNVTVTDPDGSVILVEYLDGTTVIGSSTTEPYSFTWNNPPAGDHMITVRVTDSNGGVTVSSPSTVNVSTQTGIHSFSGTDVFRIYPNPSAAGINIETSIPLETASLRFLNALGSEVFVPFQVNGTGANADVSGLAAGVYTLVIGQDDAVIRKKIIVTK